MWLDPSGNVYIFGGFGLSLSIYGWAHLNDVWKLDISTSVWTWVNGVNETDVPTRYGTLGSGTATTMLGSRQGAAGWTTSKSFYVFGGYGFASSTTNGKYLISRP